MVVDAPGETEALVALGVSEKLGGGRTVRVTSWVLVTPPPVAVTVRLNAPAAVEEAVVRINVVVPVPGAAMPAGEKVAVTPFGWPLAVSSICD